MQFLANIAQFLLVVGVSFAALTLIVSFIRFQNITRKAGEADHAIDPHDAFQVQIANRLGTVHLEPEPFLVMVLAPDGLPPGEKAAGDVLDLFREYIRKSLRGTDMVAHIGNGRIGAVADASRENAELIVRRLQEGVRSSPGRPANFSFCAGVSTHPENGNRVRMLVEGATASLEAAVLKGHGKFVLTAFESAPPAAASLPSLAPGSGGGKAPSVVDPLTGVLRQDRLSIALQKYVAQYRKREEPVSILVLEVDHFERYGEHYGPAAGDEILRRLGEFLQGAARESDLVGRLEERMFLIGMGCAPRDAMTAAQRIIGAVKKTAFPVSGSNLRITLSLGVAGYPDHGGHPRQLVEAATAALQTAKENGSSMCLMYEPTMRAAKKKASPAEMF